MDKNNLVRLSAEKDEISKLYTTPNPPHGHVKWELVFFLDGVSINLVNEKEYEVSKGDVFLIGPNHVHGITFLKTPHLHQDVYFENEEIENALKKMPSPLASQILSGERILKLKLGFNDFETFNTYLAGLINAKSLEPGEIENLDYERFLDSSLLDAILGLYTLRYFERHTTTPKWLLEFLANLQRPEVFSRRVSEIVSLTNYSHSQVGTMFKTYKGVSLVEYLIEIRMNYAKELLKVTNKSVLTISEDCGYNSLSTFIKLFREINGCSPLQYRKKCQEENNSNN